MSGRNQGRPWQAHEDALLIQAVTSCSGDIDWKEIAKYVPDRTNKACRKRWLHSLCPTVKKSAWTGEEDRTLLELYEQHGPKWSLIARQIPGRTDDACSKRYREALDPSLKKDDWTAEEDARLLELRVSLAGKWQQVGQQMGRSGLGCRNRWRLLERKRASGKAAVVEPPPGSQPGLDPPPTLNFSISEPPLTSLAGGPPSHLAVFGGAPDWDVAGFFWDSQFAASFPYDAGPSRNDGSSHVPTSSPGSAAPTLHMGHSPFGFNEDFGAPLRQPASFAAEGALSLSPGADRASAAGFHATSQQAQLPTPGQDDVRMSSLDSVPQTDVSIASHDHDPQSPPHEPSSPPPPASPLFTSLTSPPAAEPSPPPPSPHALSAFSAAPAASPLPSQPIAPSQSLPSSLASADSVPAMTPLLTATEPGPSPTSEPIHPHPQPKPFLSSSLATDGNVLAYACGFPRCWAPDDTGADSGSVAGVRFATSRELAEHMRTAHASWNCADDKPYRCALVGCKKGWKARIPHSVALSTPNARADGYTQSLNGLQYHLQVSKVHFRQALSATPPASFTSAGKDKGKKTYPCTFPRCLHIYKQASGLRYHLKHGHSPEVPEQLAVVPPSLARKMDEKMQRASAVTS
ncbi:hypothetical protein K488DRAFT_85800 [Vararia minispora EC-137]|uniref:Uncharacterized protein n=1 Tax=Vararia minispora EC-137 TaxID=1314806 RepID=A0ACB8QLK4_9AGAM|nr:hypothetical protein K488DRAFT_85800 [Vararia minispora EC-137]